MPIYDDDNLPNCEVCAKHPVVNDGTNLCASCQLDRGLLSPEDQALGHTAELNEDQLGSQGITTYNTKTDGERSDDADAEQPETRPISDAVPVPEDA